MKLSCLILLFGIGLAQLNAQGDTCAGRPPERFRVLFLLDASYSMEKKWGKETLWDLAKRTIEEFAFFLQKNYSVEMGLRVYGHTSPESMHDCEDSHLEVQIEENSAAKIVAKLKTIHYKGTTPLAYSLEKSAEDLGCNSRKNVIILITDGYETCNRNPCAIANKLIDYRISIRPLIVGLNIDYKDIEHLNCIGDFHNAKNKEEFKKELYNSFINVANKRSLSIFLRNENKKISETNMPFTIYNSKNKEIIGSFYHTLAPSKLPDTLLIGSYDSIDIKIHSIPPVYIASVGLKKFVHNPIEIPFPLGILNIKWENLKANAQYEAPEILIYKNSNWIYQSKVSDSMPILKGEYDVTLTTLPLQHYSHIQIASQKMHSIVLPSPGFLNISKSAAIYGDLYYYNNNLLTKCYTLQSFKSIENLTLLPGKYKLIYRSLRSMTIHGTYEKAFEIKSGDLVNLNL
jgi:Ca-activated chloride channel family protein